MSKKQNSPRSISSTKRLEQLLMETEDELEKIQPQIEKLEKQLEKLQALKRTKQKLITLKLSVKSILSNFSDDRVEQVTTSATELNVVNPLTTKEQYSTKNSLQQTIDSSKAFLPDLAFEQVGSILKRQNSLNYELFKAIVLSGGYASTEQIKAYLVEQDIRQPGSGATFENVELTDISARIHYLVRKNVVEPDGKGGFMSRLGWFEEAMA